MSYAHSAIDPDLKTPRLPGWFIGRGVEVTAESAGFASGSALTLLHLALEDPIINVPSELLRQRLALRAAVQSLKLQGRAETEGETRDAFHLTQAGDPMGPAGDMLAFWKAGLRQRIKGGDWKTRVTMVLPIHMRDDVELAVGSTDDLHEQSPVSRVAAFVGRTIACHPRQEAECLFAADALLANLLGWVRPLPLLALAMKRSTIRSLLKDGDRFGFEIACHNSIAVAARDTLRLAYDLARRAAALRTITPKLRAKGSGDAVALFLSEDAIFPSTMLTPKIKDTRTKMSEQAARRLCDRLIDLGVIRELTGRTTFRLYGV